MRTQRGQQDRLLRRTALRRRRHSRRWGWWLWNTDAAPLPVSAGEEPSTVKRTAAQYKVVEMQRQLETIAVQYVE